MLNLQPFIATKGWTCSAELKEGLAATCYSSAECYEIADWSLKMDSFLHVTKVTSMTELEISTDILGELRTDETTGKILSLMEY